MPTDHDRHRAAARLLARGYVATVLHAMREKRVTFAGGDPAAVDLVELLIDRSPPDSVNPLAAAVVDRLLDRLGAEPLDIGGRS